MLWETYADDERGAVWSALESLLTRGQRGLVSRGVYGFLRRRIVGFDEKVEQQDSRLLERRASCRT